MDDIRFIDLFSGIGGFRLGLERRGFQCVWSCDNNKYANQVYTKQFGEIHHYTDDIRGINPKEIPNFDLLCAGFPCQSFSTAGKRKGFQDTRGTLFFEICRIIEAKRPSLLLLENVKGLLNHDRGRTFTIILQALDELGYWVEWQVLNSKHFGVPQNRERVFIVGHLRGTGGREIFPIGEADKHIAGTQKKTRGSGSWLRDEHNSVSRSLRVGGSGHEENLVAQTISARYYKDGSENLIQVGTLGKDNQASRVYSSEGMSPTLPTPGGGHHIPKIVMPILTPDRMKKRQHGRRFKEDGEPSFTLTGQDIHGVMTIDIIPEEERPDGNYLPRERVISDEGVSRAVSTSENQHPWYKTNFRIRRLTPVECERLQGFPDGWTEIGHIYEEDLMGGEYSEKEISDTQRYKCLGNAVTVNVIEFLGGLIKSSWFTNKGEECSL